MNWTGQESDLQFARRGTGGLRTIAAVVVAAVVFALVWEFVSPGVAFWLLLPLVAALAWAASFGWRQALARLIAFLHRLERL